MGMMKALATGGGGRGAPGSMTFSLKIDASQIQHVLGLLMELPDKARKQGLKSAATKTMAHVRKAVRRLAPKDTGLLRKSIQSTVRVYGNGYIYGAVGANKDVVVEDGKGNRRWPIKYIHLVERGVNPHDLIKGSSLRKNRQTNGSGYEQHPGTEGKFFMRKGFASSGDGAVRLFGSQFSKWFDKRAAKIAARRPR